MSRSLRRAPAFDNPYAPLPERFCAKHLPVPVPAPGLHRVNHHLAEHPSLERDAAATAAGTQGPGLQKVAHKLQSRANAETRRPSTRRRRCRARLPERVDTVPPQRRVNGHRATLTIDTRLEQLDLLRFADRLAPQPPPACLAADAETPRRPQPQHRRGCRQRRPHCW